MDRFALFSTPMFVYDPPNTESLNRELTERFVAESIAKPGIQRANMGGWHSIPDVAHRDEPIFQTLIQIIVDHAIQSMQQIATAIGKRSLQPVRCAAHAWAMVMRDGDYTIVHDHGNSHWSASYYLDEGDADLTKYPNSGLFAVLDPRGSSRHIPGIEEASQSTFTVRPKTGRLVLFPGWLEHYVHPYRGTRPRVAIACNLTVSLPPSALPPFLSLG